MAPIGRAGLLQLLRGTRKPRQPRGVPRTIAGIVVAQTASPEPKGSFLLEPYTCTGPTMATCTTRAPSLSCGSLRRQSSEIRTGCANERPSGSVRGVPRKWYPYRDLKLHRDWFHSIFPISLKSPWTHIFWPSSAARLLSPTAPARRSGAGRIIETC